MGLKEIGCVNDLPETQETIEGNAMQKANYVNKHFHVNCFADDTGLEIEALNNRPGVYSARYAGENKNFDDNMNKVLDELDGIENRKACFRTVIALIENDETHFFEGRVDGQILKKKTGKDGFGYDPIFQPNGYKQSFAQMSIEQKNTISHRAIAIKKLIEFLETFKR